MKKLLFFIVGVTSFYGLVGMQDDADENSLPVVKQSPPKSSHAGLSSPTLLVPTPVGSPSVDRESKSPRKRRSSSRGGTSGGSLGETIQDEEVVNFFTHYAHPIVHVLEHKYFALLAESDKDVSEKKIAEGFNAVLQRYVQKSERENLFIEARLFFIRLLLPMALLEFLYKSNLPADDKSIDGQVKEAIASSILMNKSGWNALEPGFAKNLQETICGKFLTAILALSPDKKGLFYQKIREKIIHLWFFYFHASLVNRNEEVNFIKRRKMALRSIITMIKTVGYKIQQTVIQYRRISYLDQTTGNEKIRMIPEVIWCRDEMDSGNGSWYDTTAVVQQTLRDFVKYLETLSAPQEHTVPDIGLGSVNIESNGLERSPSGSAEVAAAITQLTIGVDDGTSAAAKEDKDAKAKSEKTLAGATEDKTADAADELENGDGSADDSGKSKKTADESVKGTGGSDNGSGNGGGNTGGCCVVM